MKRRMMTLLLAMPLMVSAAACSDRKDDRAALEKDEMDRQLDLALQSDSTPVTYNDTAVGVEPVPDVKAPPRPTPKPVTRAPQVNTPRPTPRPQRTEPVPSPAPTTRSVTSTAPSGT
ncbi:MAG: hypothetical protein ABIV28_01030, partial [Longimicrobiales bacterium]